MCECIKATEERYKEYLKENDKTIVDTESLEVGFENTAYMFSSQKTELTIPIVATWKHTAKSGRVSTKKKVQNFTIDYCPFCGEKLSKEVI